MRLLPNRPEVGWTPYAWLIYLAPIFFAPLPDPARWEIPLALVVTIVFVGLYFRFFWVAGRRQLVIAWTIVGLALIYTPVNPGASAFFIYAGAFLGIALRRRETIRGILVVMALVALESWLVPLPPASWIPALLFTPMIGMINSHFTERSRAQARLQLAQEEVEQLAKLDERERIARDLHDLLGHSLSVVTLKSELADRLLGSGDAIGLNHDDIERVRAEVRDIQEISRQAMSEVRGSISGYRTHNLQSELARAKMALAAAQIQGDVRSSPYSLDPEREQVAALALREAVTNVIRHSNALACSVTLRSAMDASRDIGSLFELIVEDDGRGLRGDEGTGLTGMRERVEGAGGTLELVDRGSRPLDGGCRLVVRLPMSQGPTPGHRTATGAGRDEPDRTALEASA